MNPYQQPDLLPHPVTIVSIGDSIDIEFRVRVKFELMVELTTITKTTASSTLGQAPGP